MKKTFVIVYLFSLYQLLFSFPKISYIIPDIGTPGLATYVEIVGPVDGFGNFGNDGLFSPENSNIRIVFDNPEDSTKVIVGPIYVSWQGRLISTYFFVNPTLATPNSEDWSMLFDQFKIPFRVAINGELSNSDTFYIVKPYNFGSLLTNNQIFGSGFLGVRSRSGSMIVENLNLSALEYKVFLDNSIAFPNPNRSYLPFVLICKENIIGEGPSTKINVSAGDGAIQNGGPGGGGGGGKFCDYLIGNPGEDGGRGFVSGGRGGTNNLFGGGSYKNLNTGTGDSGKSINGVLPPEIPYGYEASGGASGHPFGKSGIGSGDQANWNYPGGYGGGTGSINNRMGGSGGYSTIGANEPSNYNNGGKIHGNAMVIPLAGGSGGASGNPSGLNVCSGSGGGGGGAISISAKRIENLSILADGKNGGSSSNGAGGGGSGGAIIVSAKLSASNLFVSAKGGNGGGFGWIRLDAPKQSTISFPPSSPGIFHSITTDTSKFVKKNFIVTGSKSLESDSVVLFLKTESGNWSNLVLAGLRDTSFWQKNFSVSSKDTIIYFCAIEDFGSAIIDSVKYRTQYVFSQSATNIFFVEKSPEIVCPDHIDLIGSECSNFVIIDSFLIKNNGNANLILNFSTAYFKHNHGIEIINPRNDISIPPGDSTWITYKFTYYKIFGNPVFDTLVFGHNDLYSFKIPWEVNFDVTLRKFLFESFDLKTLLPIDTIDFGNVCSNETRDTIFGIKNLSLFENDFVLYNNSPFLILSSNRLFVDSNSSDSVLLALKTNSISGQIVDSIEIFPAECPEIRKKIFVKYFISNPQTQFIYNTQNIDSLNFGGVCVGQSAFKSFFLNNIGNVLLHYAIDIYGDTAEFQVKSFSDSIINISESDSLVVSFAPYNEGKFLLRIVNSFDLCGYKDTLICIGEGVKSQLVVLSSPNFGFVAVGEKDTIVVKIVNRGSGVSYVDQEPKTSGVFRFLESQPELPTYLRPDDTLYLYFEFEPQSDIPYVQQIALTTNPQFGCPDSVQFILQGTGTKAKIFANMDSIFFGVFPYCKSKDTVIYINNKGNSNLTIKNVYLVEANIPPHFSISNLPSSTIPPGGVDSCAVKFQGWKNAPSGLKTAELIIENNDLQNPKISIKLSAIQENVDVAILPDTIDFGIVQIGDSSQRNITLFNNGSIQQRISNIFGNSNNFTAVPTALVLEPSNQYNVSITFTPTRVGVILDTLKVFYYSPCLDTQYIYVRGTGISGNFSYLDTLDFGIVPICSDDTLSLEVLNLGTIPFTIDSVLILGPDSDYFAISSTLPVLVDSLARLNIVSFGGSIEKEYLAKLNLYVFINKTTQIASITLKVFRKRYINFASNKLDLGIVQLNTAFDTLFILNNEWANVAFINDFYGFDSDSPFEIFDLVKGTAIVPSSSLNFTIKFFPKNTGFVSDTLSLLIQYPNCIDTINLLVQGYGALPHEYQLRLSEITVDPRENNLRYPIFLKISLPEDSSIKFPFTVNSIAGYFNYNWHLFHIIGISKGSIVDDKIIGSLRYISFIVNSVEVKDTTYSVLTELLGVPLLGDIDSTLVQWDSAYSMYLKPIGWGRIPDSLLTSGIIRTSICREGGPRLVRPDSSFAIIMVDNGGAEPIMVLKLPTSCKVKINISNTLGQILHSKVVQNFSSNEEDFVITLPDYLPNGLYFVIFLSSEKYETIKVLKK